MARLSRLNCHPTMRRFVIHLARICVFFMLPKVAEENLKSAGFAEQVSVIVGPAANSLAAPQPEQQFDLVFIDADKASNSIYFTEAKRLVRSGGVIVRYCRPMHSISIIEFPIDCGQRRPIWTCC
jgi:precorrin-6B methylase 2